VFVTGVVAISSAILAWIANYRAQAEYVLKRTETAIRLRELELKGREMDLKELDFQLRLKQAELEMARLRQEIDSANVSPRIILT